MRLRIRRSDLLGAMQAMASPGGDTARRAFGHFKAARFAKTSYRPAGPDQRCYANVQEQIESCGGEAVTGWIVTVNNAPRLDTGRNKYAKFSLAAHSVWRKDGELIEVTTGGHCRFIIDDGVQPMTNGNLFFCDDESCARRLLRRPLPKPMTIRHLILALLRPADS